MKFHLSTLTMLLLVAGPHSRAVELHVALSGKDGGPGTAAEPLRSISAAAAIARPGDVITVHEGVYRERIDPPRGGTSDEQRITYRAAPGANVVIKGSEVVQGWERVTNDTWKVTIPNSFFGDFNPYADVIFGDWFAPQGRVHHTGAVYLKGHWLIEAASHLNEVLKPAGERLLWFGRVDGADDGDYLLNLGALSVGSRKIAADAFADKRGELHTAPNSEGGQCVGWIRTGSWLRFDRVDFGDGAEGITFRAASVTGGGEIDVRLDGPEGTLLGSCVVADTGDWQKWADFTTKIPPTRGVQRLCLVFRPHRPATDNTTIWAQLPGVDPNAEGIEINARQTVFYPSKPFVNYITVSGFTMEHAATPWAPPSAEQKGLIGTHWSKGWIIENNVIRYSKCSGVALGKYGDETDNTNGAGAADPYTACVRRALTNGWNKATVGSHLVRNNHISHCEQTGIVGSMGCSFSTVTGNEIHDIHVHRLFSGAEMAGIKFHGAIDVEISRNHIHHVGTFGVWLDWMAQGAHVTGNLFHDNRPDIFFEVDHGPFLVDHNLFLSPSFLLTVSQGGAFAHNLIAGGVQMHRFDGRMTPFHKAHSTELAGLHNNPCGDYRFYNNLFVSAGNLSPWNDATLPVWMAGNVFTKGAVASTQENNPLLKPDHDPGLQLIEKEGVWTLHLSLDPAWAANGVRQIVTTELLGKARIPDLPFERADGSPYRLDRDYFGAKRNPANPFPGPVEPSSGEKSSFTVWPLSVP
ncbi:MAG: carbohydrate-binding protein [Kiritimatiellia bacterium]